MANNEQLAGITLQQRVTLRSLNFRKSLAMALNYPEALPSLEALGLATCTLVNGQKVWDITNDGLDVVMHFFPND